MTDECVYGPDGPDGGVFEGVFEFDCSEFLPPELKAQFRIGKWAGPDDPSDSTDPVLGPNRTAPGDPGSDALPPAGGRP